MIGKHRDGGYADFIKVPARSVFALPDEIAFAQGAIMMCSSATRELAGLSFLAIQSPRQLQSGISSRVRYA